MEILALDHYPFGIAAIVIFIILTFMCQNLFIRFFGTARIRESHEVGGYYLSIAGTFYAVLLGLVVVDAMSNFKDAEKTLEDEAAAVMNIHTMSERFPLKMLQIKELTRVYANLVLTEDLPLMAKGQFSIRARDAAINLIEALKDIEPTTENQKALYPSLLTQAQALWDCRRDRTRVASYGIPTPEWVVLLVGALVTIAFTFFFVIESRAIHFAMTGMIALLIAMSLYLVLLFGAPFSGDLRVSDKAFLVAVAYFKDRF